MSAAGISKLQRIRSRITALSLAADLPPHVWSELCRLDSDLAAEIADMVALVTNNRKPKETLTRVGYSELPCSVCRVHHRLDQFRIGDSVRVRAQRGTPKESRVGMVGLVREWSQIGGPMYVRVEFEGVDEYGCPIRENFDPCMLEAIA